MNNHFDAALAFTLAWEGGYSNHPNDPGGVTNMGITQRVYDDYREGMGLPVRSVQCIARPEMAAIYYVRYWRAGGCEQMPGRLAVAHFDWCVNGGTARALRHLQALLGVQVDGAPGPKTEAALGAHTQNDVDTNRLLAGYIDRREAYYKHLAQRERFSPFLRGWLNRLRALREQVGVV